ncbi:MAG TPA: hypothetical protein VFD56_14295, partial [Chitinophagaceae bacterium]|nr:hypothetical protein [Chitinophagaceae bacterium]
MLQRLLSCSVTLLLFLIVSEKTHSQDENAKTEQTRKKILADPKISSVSISDERKTPSLITFKQKLPSYKKEQAAGLLSGYLSVRSGTDQLLVEKQSSLPNNFEVLEFQQYFRGVKVEHGRFKALIKDGNIVLFNGAWYDVPAALSVQPFMAKENALQKAKQKVNAKKYATDFFQEKIDKTNDPQEKQALIKELTDVSPKGELVLVKDFTNKNNVEIKLAYKFNIYATEPMSRAWIYVDAKNGKILLVDQIIKHVNSDPPSSVNTTVQTRYAGARNIRVKQISGNDPQNGLILQSSHPATEIYIPGTSTWVLMDDTRGKGIETYDLNGVGGVPFSIGAFYAQGKSFTDVDNNWSIFEHKRSDPLG